jgi:hypothetical protein
LQAVEKLFAETAQKCGNGKWKDGQRRQPNIPLFQHSNDPYHQRSNIPITQHSDVFLTMEERELRFLEEQKLL